VQYRHTPMSPKQKKAYAEMRDLMVSQLNDILVAPNPLSHVTRLCQFAAASAEFNEDGELRLSLPSPKVDDLEDLLEELGDEPLVVAAVSRQLIELAAERLTKLKISHGLVTGAQSIFERQDAVRRFQAGHLRVILLTLGAGAEGITLTRASRMLFMQESFSEIQNAQARDRVHRIGSEIHEFVQIIVQITPDSVEEHKLELLATKQMRMEEIVRDKPTLLKLLGVAA
jgi:SNF2 family DNA or RNA helicase